MWRDVSPQGINNLHYTESAGSAVFGIPLEEKIARPLENGASDVRTKITLVGSALPDWINSEK